ncbi:TRAP transporter small permease subunit [Breoghania sp.]|uniref:TRAP transporter small permease n=1 Tax=Breoghania sp. TaxID=2065378 RepID=UPI0029CA7133|nr:TRAP transporter small permease subunit [Breoghania sp.]
MALLTLIDRFSRALAVLSGFAIFLMAGLVVSEIVLRNLFSVSLTFVWEVSVYLHMAAIFLGSAWTLRTGGHIRVTLLQSVFPRAFEWFATLIGLAISTYMTNALVLLAWSYWRTGRTSGSTTDIALIYPAGFMAFGAVLLTVQIALRLVHLALGREPEIDNMRDGDRAPIMD